MSGKQGYNNGVTLLDTICDSCLTNKTDYPGMQGRNLKLEDFQDVYPWLEMNTANYGSYSSFSLETFWPSTWFRHEKNATDAIENRSVAYPLVEWGDKNVYGDYQVFLTEIFSDGNQIEGWKNRNFKDLLGVESGYGFWLSTRFIGSNNVDYVDYRASALCPGVSETCVFPQDVWFGIFRQSEGI